MNKKLGCTHITENSNPEKKVAVGGKDLHELLSISSSAVNGGRGTGRVTFLWNNNVLFGEDISRGKERVRKKRPATAPCPLLSTCLYSETHAQGGWLPKPHSNMRSLSKGCAEQAGPGSGRKRRPGMLRLRSSRHWEPRF